MSEQTRDTEETIAILDRKLGVLKREYDQYFLGSRPREPVLTRGEVRKLVALLSNTPIQNTALRFKFASICSRYQAFRRQWEDTLRKIEDGSYKRHQFKAQLHGHKPPPKGGGAAPAAAEDDLYQDYLDARLACGQGTDGISREKLERQLEQQTGQLRAKFGADARFQFRVAVQDGKVRLKAKRLREDAS